MLQKGLNNKQKAQVEEMISQGGGGAILTQTVTQGDTTHAPSGDAVFTAISNAVTSPGTAQTAWDASGGTYPVTDKSGNPIKALYYWTISVQGILNGEIAYVGDVLYSAVDNPGQDPTKWFVIRKSNGIVSDSYVYVDRVYGSDTNQGTILNPFQTVNYAISKLGVNGGIIAVTQNNASTLENIIINTINGYIVILGTSIPEMTIIDNLQINATTGTVFLVNITVNNIKASSNVTLRNVILTQTAEYTPNNTDIVYDNVKYTDATHTFLDNGVNLGSLFLNTNCIGYYNFTYNSAHWSISPSIASATKAGLMSIASHERVLWANAIDIASDTNVITKAQGGNLNLNNEYYLDYFRVNLTVYAKYLDNIVIYIPALNDISAIYSNNGNPLLMSTVMAGEATNDAGMSDYFSNDAIKIKNNSDSSFPIRVKLIGTVNNLGLTPLTIDTLTQGEVSGNVGMTIGVGETAELRWSNSRQRFEEQ